MDQGTNAVTQTAGSQTASLFLRSGINMDGLQGDMFADLLAQMTTVQESAAGPDANETSARTNGSEANAAPDSTEGRSSTGEDREAVRALMQRIGSDAKDVYENRQQIKRLDKKDGAETEETQDAETPAKNAAATEEPQETSNEETPETEGAESADQTATPTEQSANPEIRTVTEENDVVEALLAFLGGCKGTAGETAPEEGAAEAPAKEVPTDSGANDPLKAEQAALLLLNKAAPEGVAGPKKGLAEDAGAEGGEEAPTLGAMALDSSSTGEAVKTALIAGTASAKTLSTPRKTESVIPAQTPEAADARGTPGGGSLMADSLTSSATEKSGNTESAAGTSNSKSPITEFTNLFNAQAAGPTALTPQRAVAATESGAITGVTGAQTQPASSAQGTSPQLAIGESAKPAGSYDFASQLSATRATKGGTVGLPSAVEQVALQIHKQVKEGSDEITIQLKPAELGRVDVKLTFSENGKVQGTVVADAQATLDLLSKDVGSLQRALQDAGLRADPGCLQFSLRGDGQGGTFAGANGDGSSSSPARDYGLTGVEEAETAANEDGEIYYLTPGRVNLRV